MKRTTSNRNLFLAVIGISWLALVLLAGLISGFDRNFLEGLLFLTFGAAVALVVTAVYAAKRDTITDVFFHMPIYMSCALYYAVSAVLAFLHMVAGVFSFRTEGVVQLILFVLFLLWFIASLVSMNTAKESIARVRVKNEFIRDMAVRVGNIAAAASDREQKMSLEALADEFRYSAPAVNREIQEIEWKIADEVEKLEKEMAAGADGKSRIQTVKSLLAQRNNLAKNIR